MLDILIVEDEAPIREWLVYTIDNIDEKYKVSYSAQNGKEAYDIWKEKRQRLIITDIQMPRMDGIELTKKVKEVDEDTFIILLTNHAEFSYAKEAITYGVYEYLIKSEIRVKEIEIILEDIYKRIEKSSSESKANNTRQDSPKYKNKDNDKKYSRSIKNALDYIEKNYKNHISLGDISKHVYLSQEYFSRLFKEEVGINFINYLTLYRIDKAEYLLKNTDMKITQVADEVGYSNASYFSKSYKKYKGISPDDDRY